MAAKKDTLQIVSGDLATTYTTVDEYGAVSINSNQAQPTTTTPLTVKASSSHTANLTEWYDTTPALALYVDKDGILNGDGSGLTGVTAGSVDETDITRLSTAVYAKLSADDTFTGTPTFSGSDSSGYNALFSDSSSGYPVFRTNSTDSWLWGWIEDSSSIGLNQMALSLDSAPNTGGVPLTFPGAGGTVVTTSATQTISNKTYSNGTIKCGAASNMVFEYTFGTTKKFYFSPANLTASATRKYSGLDFDGNISLGLAGVDATATATTTTLMTNTAVSARIIKVNVYAETTTAASSPRTLDVTIGWTSNGNAKTEAVLATNGHGTSAGVLDLTTLNAYAHAQLTLFADASTTVTYAIAASGGGSGEAFRVIIVPEVF